MAGHGLIPDLAAPRLPWPVRAFNAVMTPLARRAISLDPEFLMERASKATGLTDFGDRRFEEPLRVVHRSLETEANLHPFGRLQARMQLGGLLSTRLRFVELWKRHPQLLRRGCARPIFVVGMPRTGTTFLQRLIAQDPGLRHMPLWESMAPLPKGDPMAPATTPDPRIAEAEMAMKAIHYLSPRMVAMHEMGPTEPDEEIWLMAVDFATMLFEAQGYSPSYGEWYQATDQTWAYQSLRSMLQTLDAFRPAERWILKSPQHLSQLGPLFSTFPDATVVQTHRDPVAVVASFGNMVSYGARNNTSLPDPPKLARYWEQRIEGMLKSSIDDRTPGDPRIIDVHFDALMRDPIGEVKKIYAVAGRVLGPEAEAAMVRYLADNPRGKHGAHRYRLSDVGLDEAEVRKRFAFYEDAFGIRSENAGS